MNQFKIRAKTISQAKLLEGHTYHNFVSEYWREMKVEGLGMFMLKEKLKLIKKID